MKKQNVQFLKICISLLKFNLDLKVKQKVRFS